MRCGIGVRPWTSATPRARQPAQCRIPQATLHDDADLVFRPRDDLVELAIDDVAPGRRQSRLEFHRLHGVGEGRQVDALDAEAWSVEWREPADRRFDVIATHHAAAQMAGADADAEEDRLVARLREAEPFLDEPLEARQSVARIEERHARFQRRGMGPLLEDGSAFSVVFADHDERPPDHPRRRNVGEGIGRHVGAYHGLPGGRAAHGVVDRRPQQGSGGCLAAGLLEVDSHRLQERLVGVSQHVDEMRDGRSRVAAHVAHAGLQQRLGDGEDALAVQDLSGAIAELLDVLGE